MVNPRVEKAVSATLDRCDYIITPRRWPTVARRIYVLTFPLSFPIIGLVSMMNMVIVILAAAVCLVLYGVLKLFDYLKQLWVTTDA